MDRRKLRTCLVAALVTLAGATYLARPAEAAPPPNCSDEQLAYLQGWVDGWCQGSGEGSGGTVDSCEQTGEGGYSYTWSCHD